MTNEEKRKVYAALAAPFPEHQSSVPAGQSFERPPQG